MVACTKAPRLTALLIWHPDCAGVIPFVPVSWYGVARPCALSGFAGTMMSQLTLTAAAAAVLVADGVADGEAVAAPPNPVWPKCAVSPRFVVAGRPLTAITTPITRPKTTGIA